MPLTTLGEGYRSFSEPALFEAETDFQVRQIEIPTDKAFAFVASNDGSGDFEVWKFNAASVAASASSVLIPLNPAFADLGRWILVSSGTPGNPSFLSGHGSPEGVETGISQGQTYLDLDTGGLWAFAGTPGTNTGWV